MDKELIRVGLRSHLEKTTLHGHHARVIYVNGTLTIIRSQISLRFTSNADGRVGWNRDSQLHGPGSNPDVVIFFFMSANRQV